MPENSTSICRRSIQCVEARAALHNQGFAAWTFAPPLASARGQQDLAPLFRLDGDGPPRRTVNINRRSWDFFTNYNFFGTLVDVEMRRLRKYPINLDGTLDRHEQDGAMVESTA